MCSSLAFAADGEYYTWVDAQGVIHNTLIEDIDAKPEVSPPNDDTKYRTEEQLNRDLKQYDKDNPAFYVWVDSDGVMHTEKFDSDVEQAAAAEEKISEDNEAIVGWSPILAPPFRVRKDVTEGACCEIFSDQFEFALKPYKSKQLFDPTRYRSFITGLGNRPAWYFTIGSPAKNSSGQRFLVLRVRGADISGTLIALNADFKPLHLEANLLFDRYPETWHSVAYLEAKVLIEDPDVSSFILYPDLKPAEDLSLEIRWADGTSPL